MSRPVHREVTCGRRSPSIRLRDSSTSRAQSDRVLRSRRIRTSRSRVPKSLKADAADSRWEPVADAEVVEVEVEVALLAVERPQATPRAAHWLRALIPT